ncbi:hypothetical protein JOD54_004194 [Actinokineospora baliensis]|uniref:hypothetical protein n=1 Tax=Actinokineospora baliensis TaxID=547056 RepID=UPI00195E61DE|nr:hypothetical protein [Actinokineospora baliensis]MBM7773990.1 hypothetical protein [Actinokineospora baliensis]
MNTAEAAHSVDQLTTLAARELTVLNRASRTRPAHLAQLDALFELAKAQAKQVAAGSGQVERDADLWRLREPGFLRAVCDVPLPQPGASLALIPVVLTWAVLGGAEVMYLNSDLAPEVADRPPFFAYWLSLPVYLGPLLLSALIVATVLGIMVRYVKPARARKRADATDRRVQRLEADLLRPLAVLWAARPAADGSEHVQRLGAELTTAARRFGAASERLAGAVTTVQELGTAVSKLLDGLPHLGAHAVQLGEVQQRIERDTATLAEVTAPMTALAADVGKAATTAATAAAKAAQVLDTFTAELTEARALVTATAEQRTAVDSAEQPFTSAAAHVESAARDLGPVTAALRKTSEQLRDAIHEVNWLAMVADGLRAADAEHRAEATEPADHRVADFLPPPLLDAGHAPAEDRA